MYAKLGIQGAGSLTAGIGKDYMIVFIPSSTLAKYKFSLYYYSNIISGNSLHTVLLRSTTESQ